MKTFRYHYLFSRSANLILIVFDFIDVIFPQQIYLNDFSGGDEIG